MTENDQKQLGKTLWAIADQLRGSMNADDFRDYMLSFLFLRYLSDNYEAAAKRELGTDYPDPDAIGISLYDYFRSQNIFPQRTRSRVSARMPDSEFQAHIKMDEKIPVLVIKQVALDQQHRPIEYSISYCRSDLYVFVCEE